MTAGPRRYTPPSSEATHPATTHGEHVGPRPVPRKHAPAPTANECARSEDTKNDALGPPSDSGIETTPARMNVIQRVNANDRRNTAGMRPSREPMPGGARPVTRRMPRQPVTGYGFGVTGGVTAPVTLAVPENARFHWPNRKPRSPTETTMGGRGKDGSDPRKSGDLRPRTARVVTPTAGPPGSLRWRKFVPAGRLSHRHAGPSLLQQVVRRCCWRRCTVHGGPRCVPRGPDAG